jgi:hypothetical protein
MKFSLLPSHIDDLLITHFMVFAEVIDEWVKQAEDNERAERRQQRKR